ncbi:MAG: hypothetical protein M0R75_16550 [Dehalococcoidia bacterium]|nr:hypothetical protein [Dehalococcoidia bacterium]
MPLIEQHRDRQPTTCEVCNFLETHPYLDRMLEHTLTMLAGGTLLQDLEEAEGALSMRSIYTGLFAGSAPGRPAPLEPRHWLLALLAAPEVRLTLDSTEATNG